MTQELQIANSLLEHSEVLRRLFPDTYDKTSKDIQSFIRKVMEAQELDILPAALLLMESAKEKGNESHIHWFAAAACDMICGQQPHKSPRTQIQELADQFKL